MTLPEFADAAGAKKNTVIDWQKDVSSPPGVKLAALAAVGVDVLYVLTGDRAGGQSRPSANGADEIDLELMKRIIAMLGEVGRLAGKRWAADRLLLKSLEVYQYLVKESDVSDDKLLRVMKLVVSNS